MINLPETFYSILKKEFTLVYDLTNSYICFIRFKCERLKKYKSSFIVAIFIGVLFQLQWRHLRRLITENKTVWINSRKDGCMDLGLSFLLPSYLPTYVWDWVLRRKLTLLLDCWSMKLKRWLKLFERFWGTLNSVEAVFQTYGRLLNP